MLKSNAKICDARTSTSAHPQPQEQGRPPHPVRPTRREQYYLTTHDQDRGCPDEGWAILVRPRGKGRSLPGSDGLAATLDHRPATVVGQAPQGSGQRDPEAHD
jgi:hypothetical protein